ncbi:polysaccharide deacetylase family protein [Ancylobacter amanitiformis]|uniref:Peptidoglycan/xylan/chitin deacetylase (PgdA/CDA1 family) n=1 Tax=Ancylobacter amanitiformis TaxID=217069 RepID=A0ABU0LWK6_9HYPH|nr:polysaccharide deacetylase family protein [Ancylobacter amanitiformis]MDQ0513078.1 peptidoglycan/xylan/chitin deacetylase (PgdA/CDA1 family) [Ancylobacter amanitiformis]
MHLPDHGRYDYRPITRRPDFRWPKGEGLAVYVAVNLEHFAFAEGLGAALVAPTPQPDVANFSWRDYGNRVGVWRLIALLDELHLPASVLVNSAIYDYCPEVVAAFRARGDEIVGHGRSNSERQGDLPEAGEAALIAEATAVIAQAEGAPPAGWLGPWISQSHITPDLLAEQGYRYLLDWCMDDQPVWMRTRGGGRILSVPYPQELNDIPAIMARQMEAPAFADMIIDHFEEMLPDARQAPLVMGLALHPYIVGQPHRMRHLRRALAHIADQADRIWIPRAGDIAASYIAQVPDDNGT